MVKNPEGENNKKLSVSHNKFNRYEHYRFRHATMAIADNIGFATANSSAISSLSFLLRTYFEHLCRDSINSAINSGRSEVGLEDVSYVFGINGINLTELHDYIQQVQPFTSADAHPLFPVVEPLNVPPSTELVDSSERKDAERETVGKEGAEVEEEGNKHSLHLSNSRSNARTAISQKIFPNFAGAFAPKLGFSVQKIELPLEDVYVDHRLANFLSSETVQHTIFEFDCSIAQPLRTKAAISEEQERLLKKKKKKEKRDKEKRMTEETEETTTNDGKRKKHKLKEQSTEDRIDQMPPLLQPPPFLSEEQTYTPPSLVPQQSQEPMKIPKLKIRIPSVVPATIECLPSTSLTEQNLLTNEQQIIANTKTTEILPITVTTATTEQNLLINEQQIIANTKTTEVMPKIVSTATEVTTKSVTTTIATPKTTEMPKMEKGMKKVEKGTTKAAKETEKVKTMEAKNTPTVVRAKAKVATIKAVKELKKTPIKTTKKEAGTLMKTPAPVVVPKKVEAPKTVTKTKAATIPEIPQSMPVATPITNISPIMSVSEDKQQSPAPFSVTSSGRSVKPSKRNFEETEAEKQMATKGQTKQKTAPKVAKIAATSKAPKITPTFSTTSRSNNSAEKVKAIAKAVEQIAAAHFSATPSAEIPVENANEGDEEDEPIWICPTCSVAYVEGQEMVACDDCDRWYHWGCVGILIPPPEKAQWYCTECRRKRKKAHQQTTTAGGGSSGSNSRKSSFSVGASSNVTTAKKQRIAKA